MSTLQEQIDDLRTRVISLQGSLATRALNSAMLTLNSQISDDLASVLTVYTDLSNCVRELEEELLGARQELIDLQS